ncbi:unnamed protein product, partial [Arabidopsis halleri]
MKNTKNIKSNPETSGSDELSCNSSNNWSNERGFPKYCVCGSNVSVFTSQSKLNPGRPYFRCAATRADGHLFKWVEDGMYEEVQDLLQRESEIVYMRIVGDEVKEMVGNLKEDMGWCKKELHKAKIKNMISLVCVFAVVVFVIYYIVI